MKKILASVVIILAAIGSGATAAPTAEPVDARIFMAVVPMSAEEANALVRKLVSKGLKRKWVPIVREILRMTEYATSGQLLLPARKGDICMAIAMGHDIDKAMGYAPERNQGTRQAISAYILAHEASHCREALINGWGKKGATEVSGIRVWQDESLADQRARNAMRALGTAGQNAIVAFDIFRIFCFLEGDLDHWTTPLVMSLGEVTSPESSDIAQATAELGGDQAYSTIETGWRQLHSALFVGSDGSAEQALAWDEAIATFPAGMSKALPPLAELRALTRQIWPDAPDWRLKAIARIRPPQSATLPAGIQGKAGDDKAWAAP